MLCIVWQLVVLIGIICKKVRLVLEIFYGSTFLCGRVWLGVAVFLGLKVNGCYVLRP